MGAFKDNVETTSHQVLSGVMTVFHFKPVLEGEVESVTPYEVAMMFDGQMHYIAGETQEETIGYMEDLLMETLWTRCKEIIKRS